MRGSFWRLSSCRGWWYMCLSQNWFGHRLGEPPSKKKERKRTIDTETGMKVAMPILNGERQSWSSWWGQTGLLKRPWGKQRRPPVWTPMKGKHSGCCSNHWRKARREKQNHGKPNSLVGEELNPVSSTGIPVLRRSGHACLSGSARSLEPEPGSLMVRRFASPSALKLPGLPVSPPSPSPSPAPAFPHLPGSVPQFVTQNLVHKAWFTQDAEADLRANFRTNPLMLRVSCVNTPVCNIICVVPSATLNLGYHGSEQQLHLRLT